MIFAFVETLLRGPREINNVRGHIRFEDRGNGVIARRLWWRIRRHRFVGRWSRGGRSRRFARIFREGKTRLDRAGIVVRNRNDRLAQERELVGC